MAELSLRTFQPTAGNPWNRVKAAHLLNRAGFGGTPEQIARVASMRPEAAVDDLLDYERSPEVPFPDVDFSELRELYGALLRARRERADQRTVRELANQIDRANRRKFQELRANWIGRMIRTRRPLLEKMVLFWHGLLVSGFPETRVSEHMAIQLDLFRRMAAGNFKELILAISRDPAMLSYLDNNSNRKGRPNENYARELLELFTMGIGNYTERDIKEAARAFTGWTVAGNDFVFLRNQHDDEVKTFLGRTGNWDGADIIDIVFEQTATARFLPRRLWEFFAYLGPEEPLVEELAGVFRRGNWEVKPVLRAIFRSEAFYSEKALRAQVKSPAQLVVGAVRLTGAEIPELGLARAMDLMGQSLLYPPNVGGWPRGRGWVNTATMLVRYNFSNLLVSGAMPGVGRQRPTTARVDHLIDAGRVRTAGDVIDQLVDRFLQAPLDGRRRWALLRAFGTNREETPVALDGGRGQEQLRSAVHLIMSMPEFQLH
jgi:hypothetical protein